MKTVTKMDFYIPEHDIQGVRPNQDFDKLEMLLTNNYGVMFFVTQGEIGFKDEESETNISYLDCFKYTIAVPSSDEMTISNRELEESLKEAFTVFVREVLERESFVLEISNNLYHISTKNTEES